MKQELREAVFIRDTHCYKCGESICEPVAVHHRKLRKQGGKDELSNLIAICSPCHNIAPNSVHQNPRNSYERGLLVPSWANPEEYPLKTAEGNVIYLSNDGTIRREGEEGHGW